MSPRDYDLFLSYDRADLAAVEHLARKLRERDFKLFLDVWELAPGDLWQDALEEALRRSRACVVVLGPDGIGPWENEEIRLALDKRVHSPSSFRVIPLLLPGARLPESGRLPGFLHRHVWVDFRAGLADERAFRELVRGLRGATPDDPPPGETPVGARPYRGLEAFREEDAGFFFGREALNQRLVEALRHSRFLAVVGPSGSGKSSAVRAGLLRALRDGALPGSERWRFATLVPGGRPLAELALRVALLLPPQDRIAAQASLENDFRRDPMSLHFALRLALAEEDPEVRALLLVDQFEEAFTLCKDADERKRFIDNLLEASGLSHGRAVVVLTLRADFYARTHEHPGLADRIAERQVPVTSMVEHELRQAIEEPARRVGLAFEPGLVDALLRQVLGQPGALPLLEHALLELWERRRRGRLTHEALREIGGVEGAIARRADAEYGALSEAQQRLARRVLLRLVQPGENTEDTRRPARLSELSADPAAHAALEAVIGTLAGARLLTVGRDAATGEAFVEVAHEALIRGWPLLRGWIEESREKLRLERRIGDSALEWVRLDRDPGLLLRGASLKLAREWAERPDAAPSPLEREFLATSLALAENEEAERLEAARRYAAETEARRRAEEQVARIAAGALERDGFNRLLVEGVLEEPEVVLLRALCRYLRQTLAPFSLEAMEEALASNPRVARLLADLFTARFDPDAGEGRSERVAVRRNEVQRALEEVYSFEHDRILRRLMNLIDATLRTNYFQAGEDGGRKPYLAFKFDSRQIDGLPWPVPWCETYVYSPRTEAIHLRGGKVARGGIRWSERRDDFRTEALGLLKAQMVKNAAIVPVGAKGCFLVKRPPAGGSAGIARSGLREALIQEGIECYRILLRGLLDLTDNVTGGQVVPPPRVVRYDGDDPYLVVAADKGTATFSDLANALSAEYGFWIGDSFASGGSAGYDHKHMGITARGVWEAVKRHFREMGKDVEREAFTAVGIGDMSGDVFGNGMLLSSHLRLVGAFNHLHIFIDPNPDPAASYDERRRLFELPRSSWADYSPQRISPGGGVFERNAKAIPVSPEMAARFGLAGSWVSPDELIRHFLRAEVDLLWLGGIGTYVKAKDEPHADVGDRSNDAIRVNACELRCRVVGEGANLGFTQRGRVEFALGGGRINTDFIDNCAGVACSDREVNLKLALEDALTRGRLTRPDRNPLLARLADDVASLVLRDGYLQTQGISLEHRAGDLDRHAWLLRRLEKAGRLDRRLEALPDFEEIENRRRSGIGLTRPEIAILVNAAKVALQDDLLASDLPDDAGLAADLLDYFPRLIEERHRESIESHRLRREIVAAVLANGVVDRMGPAFALGLAEEAGVTTAEVVRAYLNGREVLGVRALWTAIEALDNHVAAPVQLRMLLELRRLLEPAALWFLSRRRRRLSVAAWVARLRPGVEALLAALPAVLNAADRTPFEERYHGYTAEGVADELAASVAAAEPLVSACDLVELAQELDLGIEAVARTYFEVGARYHLPSFRRAAAAAGDDAWQKSAGQALIHDLFRCQLALAGHALRADGSDRQETGEGPLDRVLAELQTRPRPDLAMLTVAVRHLRDLAGL